MPSPRFAKKFLNYISSGFSDLPEWMSVATIVQTQSYKLNTIKIPVISDNELSKLLANTLILLGKDEVIYNPERVASHLRSVAPHISISMIPDARHMVSADQPALVNEKIIHFLNDPMRNQISN